MPEIIIKSQLTIGKTVPGVIKHYVGQREQQTPAPITMLSASTLRIGDDDERRIVSVLHHNGETNYVVTGGGSRAAQNRWRRQAELNQASRLLTQVADILRPLAADSDEPLVTEALGLLFNAISSERTRLKATPRPEVKPMEAIHVERR